MSQSHPLATMRLLLAVAIWSLPFQFVGKADAAELSRGSSNAVHSDKPPTVPTQMGSQPKTSKVIEGSPIGPNGDGVIVIPPGEYDYPNCCGWACSCEPSD